MVKIRRTGHRAIPEGYSLPWPFEPFMIVSSSSCCAKEGSLSNSKVVSM